MTGLSAAVGSSSGRSRNSRCSCFAPAPGSDKHTSTIPNTSSRQYPDRCPPHLNTASRQASTPPTTPTATLLGTPIRRHQIPQKHDQRIPTSCLARPEKHPVLGHASSFGTVQPPRRMIKSSTANLQIKPQNPIFEPHRFITSIRAALTGHQYPPQPDRHTQPTHPADLPNTAVSRHAHDQGRECTPNDGSVLVS
jgi:hypothetical protein